MKVNELISLLQTFDGDKEIRIHARTDEYVINADVKDAQRNYEVIPTIGVPGHAKNNEDIPYSSVYILLDNVKVIPAKQIVY